ncbi:MAG: DUF1405 domain-containing protein [Euryarchaeota archaeon]|nr:DUF1405 domain-containing protein [Euryarchaeota archaeon]
MATLVRIVDTALDVFWRTPVLYGVLVFAALYSAWWGYTDFYGDQFARTPIHTWPYVPDSPNAVLSWVVASVAIKAGWDASPGWTGRAWTFFIHLAIVWNVKVGLWTDFVLLYHYDHFFAGPTAQIVLEWVLVASHAGMVVFGSMLFRMAFPLTTAGYLAVLAVVLSGDYMDYLHAHLFLDDAVRIWPNGVPARDIHIVGLVTVALSVVLTTLLALGMRLRGPPQRRTF